jgi:hypothetical protein
MNAINTALVNKLSGLTVVPFNTDIEKALNSCELKIARDPAIAHSLKQVVNHLS